MTNHNNNNQKNQPRTLKSSSARQLNSSSRRQTIGYYQLNPEDFGISGAQSMDLGFGFQPR